MTADASRPRLLVSSVIRGAALEQSHGGLCLVDLAAGTFETLVDWNATGIDVSGRGGDRGLRGIGIEARGERIWVAATDRLLLFDPGLRLLASFANPYLRHCHEISIHGGRIHIVSTGFDAIIAFNPATCRFVGGLHLAAEPSGVRLRSFDPVAGPGPQPSNRFHLNSVTANSDGIYFTGLRLPSLLREHGGQLTSVGPLPLGTHNAQPFAGGIIYNDTANDRLCLRSATINCDLPVAEDDQRAAAPRAIDPVLARPFFARGLLPLSASVVAGGASPSTISLYDLEAERTITRVALSKDVRNAVHGIARWPF